MTRIFLECLCLAVALIVITGVGQSRAGDEPSPDDGARALGEKYVAAYNRHDAKAAAECCALDCETVVTTGTVTRGRAQIEKQLLETFSQNPNIKVNAKSTSRRAVGRDLVISDGTFEVTGAKAGPTQGRFTTISARRDGQWQYRYAMTMVPYVVPPGGK